MGQSFKTIVKRKNHETDFKCEEPKNLNRFSVLKVEDDQMENNNSAIIIEMPSNDLNREKKKKKKTKNQKNRISQEIQLPKSKQEKDQPSPSEEIFPILRCRKCWKTHFPSRNICQRIVSKEFDMEYPVEASFKPNVLDSATLNILLYCIKYLELKSLIDIKCTCNKNKTEVPPEDYSEN